LDNFEVAKQFFLDGLRLLQLEKYQAAELSFLASLKLLPDRISTLTNLSATQIKLKKLSEAKILSERALTLESNNAEALLNLGLIAKEYGSLIGATNFFNKVIGLNPTHVEAYLNIGIALKELKRYDEALAAYEKAISINPDYAGAWSNKGLLYSELKRYDEALAAHEKAISINPDYAGAWSNKGLLYGELKRYDEALAAYEKAININPDYAEAWFNKGVLYGELKRYDEALAAYEKAIKINSDLDYLLGQYVHTKMLIGDWSKLDAILSTLTAKIKSSQKVSIPFSVLSALDLPDMHLKASKIWINDKYPPNFCLPPIAKNTHQKIQIGYFSADFRNHPVGLLTSKLFKLHSRETFKIIAFSLKNTGQNDLIREELIQNFDQFIDVENQSDLEIAQLSRSMGIDIAIDLGGHTQGSRTGIFSYRAAPIQVNYLGYPGTMGAEYIDYIIADKTLIPEKSLCNYIEKIVYLPNTYIIDTRKIKVEQKHFERKDFGLPVNGIVFCAFNNAYKFNQKMLESWSRILIKVPNSVLWVTENNPTFKQNLVSAFSSLKIDPHRIIFAQPLHFADDHLARHQLADIFLDTSPYNAHTTALDALKSGLPVVTLEGQAFAGRVAASVINAIGLPELIANTQEEYELKAIALATDPEELKKIKAQLKSNLNTKPLFNPSLFTNHIEAAFIKMYERYQADLPPDHIQIDELE